MQFDNLNGGFADGGKLFFQFFDNFHCQCFKQGHPFGKNVLYNPVHRCIIDGIVYGRYYFLRSFQGK